MADKAATTAEGRTESRVKVARAEEEEEQAVDAKVRKRGGEDAGGVEALTPWVLGLIQTLKAEKMTKRRRIWKKRERETKK